MSIFMGTGTVDVWNVFEAELGHFIYVFTTSEANLGGPEIQITGTGRQAGHPVSVRVVGTIRGDILQWTEYDLDSQENDESLGDMEARLSECKQRLESGAGVLTNGSRTIFYAELVNSSQE